ncbi:MAG: cytochrome c maturation protein CcmE [bacterium]|nr:cytochrome c maturation protein CcmE [bacterium]
MKKSRKFLIAGLVIVTAIVALVYIGIKESGVYFMTVTELKAKGSTVAGQGLRASGTVIEGSISEVPKELILRFQIKDDEVENSDFINVYYKGIKPDSFKADVQVILEGKYDAAENLFKATMLLVKCPSRYEGEEVPEDHNYSGKKVDLEVKPLAD